MKQCHHHNVGNELKYFINRLKENGSRITRQREDIIKAIVEFGGPFSAYDLSKKITQKTTDLATIYRSLTAFAEFGLLTSVDLADGTIRYEYNCKEEKHHHHVICTNCKAIEAVPFCVVQGQEQIIEQMGYRNVTHKLEFFGQCQTCAGQA